MEVVKSLLVSEVFFPLFEREDAQLDAVARALDTGFYGRIEVGALGSAANRRRLRDLAKARGAELTVWTIPTMTAEKLSLSSPDAALRRHTVERLRTLVGEAAACGAELIGIPSGADPGPALRRDATRYLADSLLSLKEKLAEHPGVALLIEPLDREVHKRQLIGPMEEAVELVKAVRAAGVPLFICWDSAHEALGGADLLTSFALAAPYMAQFHLCNAVLDPASALYGDYHLPVGEAPEFASDGYLTLDVAAQVLRAAQALGAAQPQEDGPGSRLSVTLEVRTQPDGDGFETEALVRAFLQAAFDRARGTLGA